MVDFECGGSDVIGFAVPTLRIMGGINEFEYCIRFLNSSFTSLIFRKIVDPLLPLIHPF